jgi:hypothetical protein
MADAALEGARRALHLSPASGADHGGAAAAAAAVKARYSARRGSPDEAERNPGQRNDAARVVPDYPTAKSRRFIQATLLPP